MANSYLCSFDDLFSLKDEASGLEINKILIPIIQRDYAQGRENDDVIRVRDRFLSALHSAINGTGICLDFIYGDVNNKGNLIPLDGQQRLTTLFLLYWYAAKKENCDELEYKFLENFTYATRPSSRDFCNHLVGFNPVFKGNRISEQIINQSWFPLGWKNDPTISSMLVMIDKISEVFKDTENLWKKLNEDKKVQFYFLPIKNMGLTDELYIKMNSRGKPLTAFEHFKADFERQIKKVNEDKGLIVERKIDIDWTDFLWRYRTDDGLTDTLFLNYFKYICDIICYEENKSAQNRSYDDFDLINQYFTVANKNAEKNLIFLEKAFDCWSQFGDSLKGNLFAKFISIDSVPDKAKLASINVIDLLKDCLHNYYDASTGKRKFTFPKFILLYAFLQYALNKGSITDDQMRERIRIVNNLVSNSSDEMNDSESRDGGNRLPGILKQTKSIIVEGVILEDKVLLDGDNKKQNHFNSNQIEEEKEKMIWRKDNPDKVNSLNLLENHDLLNGQISIVGLENHILFDKFGELFKCDKDKISCALLTFGDCYRRIGKSEIYQFGSTNSQSWKLLFQKRSADGFEEIKYCLVQLLSSSVILNNESLDILINDYIERCALNSTYDWKYYFIKYQSFRPNRSGKYLIEPENKYCMYALWAPKRMSENAFQTYLNEIDSSHLDRDNYGKRLLINNQFVYCKKDSFVLKDLAGSVINELKIKQKNGIDQEDRIKKYLDNPLA